MVQAGLVVPMLPAALMKKKERLEEEAKAREQMESVGHSAAAELRECQSRADARLAEARSKVLALEEEIAGAARHAGNLAKWTWKPSIVLMPRRQEKHWNWVTAEQFLRCSRGPFLVTYSQPQSRHTLRPATTM